MDWLADCWCEQASKDSDVGGGFCHLIAQVLNAQREQHRMISTFFNVSSRVDKSSAAAAIMAEVSIACKSVTFVVLVIVQ